MRTFLLAFLSFLFLGTTAQAQVVDVTTQTGLLPGNFTGPVPSQSPAFNAGHDNIGDTLLSEIGANNVYLTLDHPLSVRVGEPLVLRGGHIIPIIPYGPGEFCSLTLGVRLGTWAPGPRTPFTLSDQITQSVPQSSRRHTPHVQSQITVRPLLLLSTYPLYYASQWSWHRGGALSLYSDASVTIPFTIQTFNLSPSATPLVQTGAIRCHISVGTYSAQPNSFFPQLTLAMLQRHLNGHFTVQLMPSAIDGIAGNRTVIPQESCFSLLDQMAAHHANHPTFNVNSLLPALAVRCGFAANTQDSSGIALLQRDYNLRLALARNRIEAPSRIATLEILQRIHTNYRQAQEDLQHLNQNADSAR